MQILRTEKKKLNSREIFMGSGPICEINEVFVELNGPIQGHILHVGLAMCSHRTPRQFLVVRFRTLVRHFSLLF